MNTALMGKVICPIVCGLLMGCHSERHMRGEQGVSMGMWPAAIAPQAGPRPLGKWMEASVGASNKIDTTSDRVFIADGSVGSPVIARSYANYYTMVGPTALGSVNPNLAKGKAELKNSEPYVSLELGVTYASGRRPLIRTTMVSAGTSSTHIAVQVKAAEGGNPEINRVFLFYAESGQSVNITPLVPVLGPLAGQSIAIVAPDDSVPQTDHWYIEVTPITGGLSYSVPTKINLNDGSEVANLARDILARAEAQGIPHP